MIPILFNSTETLFTTNGIGRLADAVSCVRTEQRNGVYEIVMEYPVTGAYYDDIELFRYIYDGQPFEIYEISKPLNGIVTIRAWHISYKLNRIVVQPFTASTCSNAIAGLGTNAIGTNPFTFWTDKVVSAEFAVNTPQSIRSVLGGQEGSILDVYGGEYEWDKFTVKLHDQRGTNRGVTIRYGKNLTELKADADMASVYTGIVPYYYNPENKTLVTVDGYVVWSSHRSEYPYDLVKPVDFTSRYYDAPPDKPTLKSAAEAYVASNNGWQLNTNLRVSFIDLADTEEYKDVASLQQVQLCDTVTILHEGLGVSTTAKVIRTEYDVLNERFNEIELGDAQTTLEQQITESIGEELTKDLVSYSVMDSAIANGTAQITGVNGGHIKVKTDANGKPQEALVLSGETEATSQRIWRWNLNGIGYSNDYGSTYNQAWTMDGHFYTDWITAAHIKSGLVVTGTLQSLNGNLQFDLDNALLKLTNSSALRINAGNLQVDSSGNVTITGTIHSTAGDVGGWEITPTRLRRTVSPTASAPGYQVELLSPASINSDGTTPAIRVQTADATSGDPDWANQFLVRYNGMATVKGEIRADSGKIGGSSGLTILDGKGLYSGNKNSLMSGRPGIYVGTDGFSIGNNGTYRPALWCDYSDEKIRVAQLDFVTTPDSSPYWGNGHALLLDDKKRIFSGAGCNFGSNAAYNPPGGEYDSCIYNTLYYGSQQQMSDKRIKKNVKDLSLESAKEFILGLNPVSYQYEQSISSDHKRHHGMIAQDVQKVVNDDWGVVGGTSDTILCLNYTEMIADLIKVVQDQERRIAELEERL